MRTIEFDTCKGFRGAETLRAINEGRAVCYNRGCSVKPCETVEKAQEYLRACHNPPIGPVDLTAFIMSPSPAYRH